TRRSSDLLKFAFSYVLNVLVDCQDTILAGIWLFFDTVEISPASIDLDQHPSGLAPQFFVKLALDAAQFFIVHPDIAKYLGSELALGIEALRFLFEIDFFQVQRFDAFGSFRAGFARHPVEGSGSFASRQHFAWVIFGDVGNQGNRLRQVGDFGGDGEAGVYADRHGQ